MSVRYPIVMDMAIVLVVNVRVLEATRESCAKKVSSDEFSRAC